MSKIKSSLAKKSIAKWFQDLKSSGFNIARSKMRKYPTYKRVRVIVMAAHSVLVRIGHIIVEKLLTFLKNSALRKRAVRAFFLLSQEV